MYMCVKCVCTSMCVCVIPGVHPRVPMALWPEADGEPLCLGNRSISKGADVSG